MRIETAGTTHVGMKRAHNEDAFLLLPDESLFCVADGMGGHSCGEIASKMAIEELAEFYKMTSRDQEATWPYKMDRTRTYDENRLATAVKLANVRIFERASSDTQYKGMGTTIVTMHFASNQAYLAHVGDSRGYCLRDGALRQLTEDHSLLNDYLKARKLTQEEVEAFPHKNVIVRALGMKETVDVDVGRFEPKDGDTFLLCSDGLSTMVPDAQIQEILSSAPALEPACEKLIDLANAAGGNDNVTCVLIRCTLH
jgi:PPM family protein phosphatase